MEELTKEEAEKFYNESEKPQLTFKSYFKYSFGFAGENESMSLEVSYGGNSGYIYRFDVSPEPIAAPKDFQELMDTYYSLTLVDKATGKSFSDYHYD